MGYSLSYISDFSGPASLTKNKMKPLNTEKGKVKEIKEKERETLRNEENNPFRGKQVFFFFLFACLVAVCFADGVFPCGVLMLVFLSPPPTPEH